MLPGIGVFGSGSIIKILVPILKENGFKVEAVWCRTLQEGQEVAKELDIPFFTNKIDEVLLCREVDLIFVFCSPNLHAQISVKALGIGKHVICDRPAGLCQSDALKMVKASQYYPTLISLINYSFRFSPAVTHLYRAIKNNHLNSQITLIDIHISCGLLVGEHDNYDWNSVDIMGGGMLNLIGSHIVDLINFLTGKRVTKVNGVIRTFNKKREHINGIRHISAPDCCIFQMHLEDNTLVNATLNSHAACNSFEHEILVYGTSGYLIMRNGDLFSRTQSGEEVLYKDTDNLLPVTPTPNLPRPIINGLCKMVEALREAFLPVKEQTGWIKEPVAMAANFDDGLYVQAVVDAICRSAQNLQWVPVTIMTEQPDTNALLSAAVRRTAINMA